MGHRRKLVALFVGGAESAEKTYAENAEKIWGGDFYEGKGHSEAARP